MGLVLVAYVIAVGNNNVAGLLFLFVLRGDVGRPNETVVHTILMEHCLSVTADGDLKGLADGRNGGQGKWTN